MSKDLKAKIEGYAARAAAVGRARRAVDDDTRAALEAAAEACEGAAKACRAAIGEGEGDEEPPAE